MRKSQKSTSNVGELASLVSCVSGNKITINQAVAVLESVVRLDATERIVTNKPKELGRHLAQLSKLSEKIAGDFKGAIL